MRNKSQAKLKAKSENNIEKWDTKMKSNSQVKTRSKK
jgi:hypothetical protein